MMNKLIGNSKRNSRYLPLAAMLIVLFNNSTYGQKGKYLFEKISSAKSNIHFVNEITDSLNVNSGKYIYIANSSGTGAADLNGDGNTDVFFSSNTGEYKLYLNEGKFVFRDVTGEANIKGNGKWATGVCIADINGDGLLDIYVSHSGNYKEPELLCNEAYICTGIDGKGVPHYVDKAKELGLDLPGTQTSQSAFFDFDRDGDLDCFVLNHSNNANGERLIRANFMRDTLSLFIGYNLLLRNDNEKGKQHYTDVSVQAGIVNSRRNFGLGVVVSDYNDDGWPDIYTTSDFAERDFLYLNNKDGTFTETAKTSFGHISQYSMGVDAADINNDLLPDLMTVDMLPDDNYHLKMQLHPDNTDQFEAMVNMALSKQYAKNMLQLNMGSDNGVPKFAEIAQMAGVSNTNWSWSPLFIDFNNDGWKDLFVSNGFFKDYTDQDVQNKYMSARKEKSEYGSKKLNSCLFFNNKAQGFTKIESWKADAPEMSYSACAADFDNDGKVDLIINNLNSEVSVLRNVQEDLPGKYIKVRLKQNDKNTFAIGAKVYVTSDKLTQMQEMEPVRGYQSSQDYLLHFGLGNGGEPVKIKVIWPDGSETEQVAAPQTVVTIIKDSKAKKVTRDEERSKWKFRKSEDPGTESLGHIENKYSDFKFQFTLPYKQSTNGPGVAEGDINGDGTTDYYIGGSVGNEGYFMLGQQDGSYKKYTQPLFNDEKFYEDVAATLSDLDGDGDKDLVVISGGVENPENEEFLRDRIYENDGKGNFTKVESAFPKTIVSKSCVAVGDFNKDGKPDLFIGGYTIPGKFEEIPQSYIFKNESSKGSIKFTDVTATVLPAGAKLGMVKSASWVDMDGDNYPELAVNGEWMPCKLFANRRGILNADPKIAGFDKWPGLYAAIFPTDYNEDGRIDFIAGNSGINHQFKASADQPMKIFSIRDSANKINSGFLFSYYCKEVEAFASSRNELLKEFVPYRKNFPDFKSYASVDVPGFFEKVNMPIPDPILKCTNLLSGVYINKGNGTYDFEAFPELLQASRVSAVEQIDWNFDGKKDYVVSGNFLGYKNQFGPSDAMPAYILENEGGGKYRLVSPVESGLFTDGQIKKICVAQTATKCRLLFVRNNDKILIYENIKK